MPSETAPNIRANRVMATTSSTIVNPASAPAGTTGRLRTLRRTSDRGRGRRGHGSWRTAVRLIGSTRGELNPPEGLLEDGLALAEGERAAGGPELGAALADVDHPVGTGDGAALGRLVALAVQVHLDVAHAAAAEDAEQRQLAPGAGATARGGGRGGAAADQRLERVLGGERDRRRRRHGGGGRRHARLGRGGGGGPGPAAAGRRGEHDLGRRGRPAAEGRGDQRVEHQQHHAEGGGAEDQGALPLVGPLRRGLRLGRHGATSFPRPSRRPAGRRRARPAACTPTAAWSPSPTPSSASASWWWW